MRPGLLGEMLGTVERNISRRNLTLNLFEIGKAFCGNSEIYPEEREELCIAMTGLRRSERYSDELKEEIDFYDLKGCLEALFELANVKRYRFVAADDARFEKGRAAQVWIEGKLAGMFGELAHDLSKGRRTTHKIYVAQLDVDPILAADHGYSYYVPFSLYPATTRDVAFIAPEKLDNAEVLEFIRKCKLPNVESARLFDLFVDDKLKAEHKKSVAYQVTFRNAERTLTDNEVNSSFEKLRTRLANELKVELR